MKTLNTNKITQSIPENGSKGLWGTRGQGEEGLAWQQSEEKPGLAKGQGLSLDQNRSRAAAGRASEKWRQALGVFLSVVSCMQK